MKKFFIVTLSVIFLSVALICAAPHPAMADVTTTFSFASDTFHQGPTFTGEGLMINSESEIELMVDLNSDTYGGLVTFLSKMRIQANMHSYQIYSVGPQYLHVWKVTGEILFNHINAVTGDQPILTIQFREAVLTSWSPSPNELGESMTLQDNENADPAIIMAAQPLLVGIGVNKEFLNVSEDFAFTFTNIRLAGKTSTHPIPIEKDGYIKGNWLAEGSFSASACYPK